MRRPLGSKLWDMKNWNEFNMVFWRLELIKGVSLSKFSVWLCKISHCKGHCLLLLLVLMLLFSIFPISWPSCSASIKNMLMMKMIMGVLFLVLSFLASCWGNRKVVEDAEKKRDKFVVRRFWKYLSGTRASIQHQSLGCRCRGTRSGAQGPLTRWLSSGEEWELCWG